MRRACLTLACLALTACSSGGGNRILMAAIDQIRPGREAPAPPSGARLTRAQVEASGAAMIRARLLAERGQTVMTAASENGGYITYLSALQQSLTLRGARITASRGLGFDLLALRAPGDPLSALTPLRNWPASVTRTYLFPADGPEGQAVTVTCTFEAGPPGRIEIVEVAHVGTEVTERCTGGGVRFDNWYFVGAGSGRVWASRQWLGPDQGVVELEVVEPFTP